MITCGDEPRDRERKQLVPAADFWRAEAARLARARDAATTEAARWQGVAIGAILCLCGVTVLCVRLLILESARWGM